MQHIHRYWFLSFAVVTATIITLLHIGSAAAAVRVPINLTAAVTCSSGTPTITLTWVNPNNAKDFTIFRNPSQSGRKVWVNYARTAPTTYTDVSVKVSETYQYQVQAISQDGIQRHSDIVTVSSLACPSKNVATNPAPISASAPVVATLPLTTTTKTLKWGAYPGWQLSEIANFELQVGKSPDHITAFTHWENGSDFPTYLAPYAKNKGRTLIIFWEASNHNLLTTNQPRVSYDAILSGNWDSYIKRFAEQARAYGGPVILIPFSEANGNWNSWSGTTNGNTPAKAVLGYRHVRTVFGDVPNVKFGWAPNSNSVPDTAENAIEKYYPGNAYVDYVGVDGFNFANPWLTFDQLFKKPLTLLSTYGKPIYIFSFASAPGSLKPDWITNALKVEMQKYPLVVGWNWFNQNKEKNWAVWSDGASLTAFKNALP